MTGYRGYVVHQLIERHGRGIDVRRIRQPGAALLGIADSEVVFERTQALTNERVALGVTGSAVDVQQHRIGLVGAADDDALAHTVEKRTNHVDEAPGIALHDS